jgi:hypothetical protein
LGAPKSSTPLIEGVGTFLRPGNLTDIADLLPRRKTNFSESVMSSLDLHGTRNADKDGGLKTELD